MSATSNSFTIFLCSSLPILKFINIIIKILMFVNTAVTNEIKK
jgi:hypothetical protein